MSGIGITVEIKNLEACERLLTRLELFDAHDVLTQIAGIGEAQTVRRIEEEKTAPDGTPWLPNQEGGSILNRTGEHLRTTIASSVNGDTAEWGSWWQHAHVHQDGATIVPKGAEALAFRVGGKLRFARKVTIPSRPFVGLSEENGREIEMIVTDYLHGIVGP